MNFSWRMGSAPTVGIVNRVHLKGILIKSGKLRKGGYILLTRRFIAIPPAIVPPTVRENYWISFQSLLRIASGMICGYFHRIIGMVWGVMGPMFFNALISMLLASLFRVFRSISIPSFFERSKSILGICKRLFFVSYIDFSLDLIASISWLKLI